MHLFMQLPGSSITLMLHFVLLLALCYRTKGVVKLPPNVSVPAAIAFGDSIMDSGNNNNIKTLAKCNFPPYGKDFQGGIPTGRFCNGKIPSDLLEAAANAATPALFAFGDSILDTGNNNNLGTLTKSNFPPYGRDFLGARPTGRFCDGKIPSDFIAGALGIKETLPAYLDPFLRPQDLATGVSFASAGTGNDDLTATIQGVLTLSAQLRMFRDYIGRLRAVVGEQQAGYIISNSLYLLSSGNNDIAITYSSTIRRTLLFNQYSNLLVGWASNFLRELYQLGARRAWVLSTLPLGCLPGARTVGGGPLRLCAELVNGEARIFNGMLFSAVNALRANLPDYNLQFVDVYTPLLNIIQNPLPSGFLNVAFGCCGTGTFELAETCNLVSGSCPNPAAYVFWDAGHPTQRAYQIVFSFILREYYNNASSSLLAASPSN